MPSGFAYGRHNTRYSTEIMSSAYDRKDMGYWQAFNKDIAIMAIPMADEIEVYFYTSKENADLLMKDLFTVIFEIDAMVNDSQTIAYKDVIDEYDISYFKVYDSRVDIGYVSTKVNSNFEVKVYKDGGQWYCSQIGTKTYEPPLSLNT